MNPRFHYIDWLQPFVPALCANQSLALAASLPNIETLQLSHRAGHWGTSICRRSWMGIPKLLPGLQYEAVGRKANPAGSWVGSVFLGARVPKRIVQPVMHEMSKRCSMSDFRGTQQCQVQQQEKPHTVFESLAPEYPCIPLYPFPLYYKCVFISFSETVMPSVGSKVG